MLAYIYILQSVVTETLVTGCKLNIIAFVLLCIIYIISKDLYNIEYLY